MTKKNYKKSPPRNFTLKQYKEKGVYRYETTSIRRFLRLLRTIKWSESLKKVYLRISCGKQKDCFGKLTTFYNEGEYFHKSDFELALKAFL